MVAPSAATPPLMVGGAYNSTVVNCKLDGNSAAGGGGGVSNGTLLNSTLTHNSARYGGGDYYASATNCLFNWNSASHSGGGALSGSSSSVSSFVNCTLVGNSAVTEGGGVWGGKLTNCIVCFNTAALDENTAYSGAYYSTTTPDVSYGGGNLFADPQMASASHLSAASPCRAAGFSKAAESVDIDREPWLSPPSIGCDEYHAGAVTGAVSVAILTSYRTVATETPLTLNADIAGRVTASRWEFHDGLMISNRPSATRQWPAPGTFAVILRAYNESYPTGMAATTTVQVISQPVYYVRVDSATPVPPYFSWNTAAKTIQDAVDTATPGALVLVSNGVYAAGGRVAAGFLTNRVVVTKPMEVRSLNGPQVSVIQGYQVPNTVYGDSAVRCAFLGPGAFLSGFTLTGGATRSNGDSDRRGGGIFAAASAVVTNCVISNNAATAPGVGVFAGKLSGCLVISNNYGWGVNGGGCYRSSLSNCTVLGNRGSDGGGATDSILNNCVVSGNSAAYGGGIKGGSAWNCLLIGNSAGTEGGGAHLAALINCTIVSNAVYENSFYGGGGFSRCAATNCVVYYNTARYMPNHYFISADYILDHCCTTPLPEIGVDNFTNPPAFVDPAVGNWRLQPTSLAINSGRHNLIPIGPDLDGLPRIVGGTVDIGAYEFQSPASTLSHAWARQYGLPTDGSADFADTDLDGHNNWQEWRTDTSPTNALSRLALLAPTSGANGLSVTWESVATRSYFLERGTNLAGVPALLTLATNLPGQAGTTTFTDTTATNGGLFFYRIGVQE